MKTITLADTLNKTCTRFLHQKLIETTQLCSTHRHPPQLPHSLMTFTHLLCFSITCLSIVHYITLHCIMMIDKLTLWYCDR